MSVATARPMTIRPTAEVIEKVRPLCPQTEKLLAPLKLSPGDRIHIDVTRDMGHFVFRTYSVRVRPTNDVVPTGTWVVGRFLTHARPAAVEDYMPSHGAMTDNWVKTRLPENTRLEDGRWQTPVVDTSALVLTALWPAGQIVWGSEEAKIACKYLVDSFAAQLSRAEMQARFKATGEVQGYKAEWYASEIQDPDLAIANYQRQAVACSYGTEAYALFKEQGTGKTYSSIRRIDLEVDNPTREHPLRPFRVLCVVPKAVRKNWENEINKFSTQESKYIGIIRGGRMDRTKAVIEALSAKRRLVYVIASYDTIRTDIATFKAVQWDMILGDESHTFKSNYSKITKIMATELRDCGKMRQILTGTPITNHLGDLYWQLEFLLQGGSGFSSFKSFKKFYMKITKAGRFDIITGVQNVPLLQERLARYAFLMRQEEALPDLPPLTHDVYEVEMTPQQKETYMKVAEQLRIELENEMDEMTKGNGDARQLTINNVLTRMLRLAQVTSGFIAYDADIDEETGLPTGTREIDRFDPNPKVEALVEILQNKLPHEKTRVWCHWVQDVRTISARLNAEGIKHVVLYGQSKKMNPDIEGNEETVREEVKRRFNEDPTCRVIIANAAVGGTGVNLCGNAGTTMMEGEDVDIAGDHDIVVSQDWSMVKRSQLEKRGHRRGTKRHVRVTDLMVPGTIDEELRNRVTGKRINAYQLQDLRDIMTRLLTCLEQ